MNKKFNYKKYWQERLRSTGESLKGVGHKSYGEYANELMYKKTQIQLEKALRELKISLKEKTVLDAGAGIGVYTEFYLKRGARVTAVDISDRALQIIKKKYPNVETIHRSLSDINNISNKFNIVHCFDVLYHITNEEDWEKTIDNFGKLSKKYIIIHNINNYWFKKFNFLFERKHIKVKNRNSVIEDKLGKLGFRKVGYYPTHILYVRPILHLLVKIIPYVFYSLDKFLILNLKLRGWESTGITVYEKEN